MSRLISLLIFVLIAGALSLFTIQNIDRMTDLSLDLYFMATHLKEPASVPVLMWVAFGGGLLLGGAWGIQGRMKAGRRIRDLEQDVARASLGAPTDDAWT